MSAGVIAAHALDTYAAAVLADSPIGYWKLDEPSGATMFDSSGNGRDGSYTASPTLGATGLVVGGGTSVTLNGTTQYGAIPDASAYDVNTITVEAWIKSSQTTGIRMIVGRDTTSTSSSFGRSFQLRLNAGKPEFIAFVGASAGLFTGTATTAAGTTGIADGNVHHVVGTYDGTTVIVYVDGSSAGTQAGSGFLAFAKDPMIGGTRDDIDPPPNSPFGGTLGHVAYYGTALSSGRISAHRAAGI